MIWRFRAGHLDTTALLTLEQFIEAVTGKRNVGSIPITRSTMIFRELKGGGVESLNTATGVNEVYVRCIS